MFDICVKFIRQRNRNHKEVDCRCTGAFEDQGSGGYMFLHVLLLLALDGALPEATLALGVPGVGDAEPAAIKLLVVHGLSGGSGILGRLEGHKAEAARATGLPVDHNSHYTNRNCARLGDEGANLPN